MEPLWRTVWRFLKKLGIKLPYNPAIPLLEKNHNSERHMYPNFTVALFTITRIWKERRCPLTDEWVKKMWYIHTMNITQL